MIFLVILDKQVCYYSYNIATMIYFTHNHLVLQLLTVHSPWSFIKYEEKKM